MRLKAASSLNSVHRAQDRLGHEVDAGIRVQHHVVESAAGPFGVEVLADEESALVIDGIDHLLGFFRVHLEADEAANLLVSRSEDKDAEGVVTFAQDVWAAASNDDAV